MVVVVRMYKSKRMELLKIVEDTCPFIFSRTDFGWGISVIVGPCYDRGSTVRRIFWPSGLLNCEHITLKIPRNNMFIFHDSFIVVCLCRGNVFTLTVCFYQLGWYSTITNKRPSKGAYGKGSAFGSKIVCEWRGLFDPLQNWCPEFGGKILGMSVIHFSVMNGLTQNRRKSHYVWFSQKNVCLCVPRAWEVLLSCAVYFFRNKKNNWPTYSIDISSCVQRTSENRIVHLYHTCSISQKKRILKLSAEDPRPRQ